MKASRDATIFIDLSFLSPEEESIIQKVLVRDEDLKKHEIVRVRKLRETVPDRKELKVLSGEWFEDLKSKRYGRQPHVSAVVRSSMRWKKTAGHNTNPFLKAVPGDKGGEKNKTRPDVSTDPRSIHPALSVQMHQENKDEAIVLEESSGAELNKPVLTVIEAGRQSGPKLQEQTSHVESFKMEPVQESKMKEVDTKMLDSGKTDLKKDRVVETSWDTRDPGRTELKEDRVVKTSWDTRDPGRTELKEDRVVKTSWDTRDPGRTELKEDRVVKTSWDSRDPGRTELKEDKVVKTSWDTRDPGRTELKEDKVVKTSWDTRDPGRTELKEDRVVKTSWDSRDPGRTELKEDKVVKTSWDTRDPGRTELKEDKVVKTSWDTRDPGRTELKEDRVVKTSWDSRDPGRTELKEDKVVKTSWDTRDPGRTELKEDKVVKTSWDTRDPGRTELKEDKVVKTSWDTRDPGRTELKEDKVVKTSWDTRDPGRTELKEDKVVKTSWDTRDPGRTELKEDKVVKTSWDTRDPGRTELKEDKVVKTSWDTRDPGRTELKEDRTVKTSWDTRDPGRIELKEDRVVKTSWDSRDPGRTELKEDKVMKTSFDTQDPGRTELKENRIVKTSWDTRDPGRTELKEDRVVRTSWDTRDPGRIELKEDRVVETNLENRPKQTDEKTFRNFEIRSFSQAQESGNWGFGQLVTEDKSIKPQSKVEVVIINSNNRTETEEKNKQESPRPRESSILINSGSGFEEIIQSPVPKKRSVNRKQTTPTRTEELSVDLNMKKDPGILEDLKPSPVNNVNTQVYFNVDQKSLDPVPTGKESAVQEIMVDDFKRRSPTRTEELSVDLDQTRNPDIFEGPVSNVNPGIKYASLDKSLDPVQKGKERVVEEILVADFKQSSSTRTEELIVDLDVENNSDILEGPGYNVNPEKSVNWKQKTFDPARKGKEEVVEEIVVQEFKQRSPKRLEERSVDLNVEENPDIVEDLKTRQVQKDGPKYESGLADTKRDELPDSVMKNRKNEPAGGKNGFDVKLRESESTNQKVSKEIEAMEKGGIGDENGISESDILASVYARATRPKPGVSKSPFSQEPTQTTVEVIPTIVIVSSESEEPKEMELVKNETPTPEAVVEVLDTWEDVVVDSDEDSSSASSHDSDLSGKRSQVSATTLSVKERTASLLSVYSDAGDFGNVAVQGSVEFAIMYSPLGELIIMVEQCQDLAIANARKQRTDPYVKTYLYPDKRSKRKTSIKKHTVNPVFVESLRYKVKREELHGKTLNLSVWHNDSRGRNAFLGQVEINLKDWDWKHEAVTWYNLQPKTADILESQEYRGIIFISLKYVPAEATGGSRVSQPTGEIHIWLREAKHLRRLKAQGVDSFVKCYMLPDTSKKSRQKTRVVKKTQDPVYNHTMVYDGFRVGELCEACCELTVWDNHKLSNQFLGGVRLSLGTGQSYGKKVDWMDSENEEVEIWKKMMSNPNSWVEGELPLRASMTPRK